MSLTDLSEPRSKYLRFFDSKQNLADYLANIPPETREQLNIK
jgi:hypothetical protein